MVQIRRLVDRLNTQRSPRRTRAAVDARHMRQLSRAAALFALCIACCSPALAKGDGEEMLDNFVKQQALIENPALVDYVRAVGQRVAAKANRPDITFHFNVVDDASVNAFATEDGYIFVHRGLLAYLEREDQLAGVLGHEVAHVTLTHVGQTKRGQFLNKLAGFAAGLLTLNSDIQRVVEAYGAERIRGFGREFELQADQAGAEYMMAAGYDPQAMIEVVQVLKDQELFAKRVNGQDTTYHGLFASHPRNDQRLQQAIAAVSARMTSEVAEPVGDYLQIINGLTWGNAGAAGAIRGQNYYHGRLGFVLEVPEGWVLAESPTKLLGYLPGGATSGFVSMEMQAAQPGLDSERILIDVVKPGELRNGEKLALKDGEKTMDAYLATVVQPAGTAGVSLVAVVVKDGRVHVFRGETREPTKVETLRTGMRYVLDHFRTMTLRDLQVANTERIALHEAQPEDSYESLARSTPLAQNGPNELRLLNGDYPHGQPRAGDRIKLVK